MRTPLPDSLVEDLVKVHLASRTTDPASVILAVVDRLLDHGWLPPAPTGGGDGYSARGQCDSCHTADQVVFDVGRLIPPDVCLDIRSCWFNYASNRGATPEDLYRSSLPVTQMGEE